MWFWIVIGIIVVIGITFAIETKVSEKPFKEAQESIRKVK